MKLIAESIEDVEYITEAREDGNKDCYIRGIFMQGNIKNRNGRMYPVDVLEKEVGRYVNEVVKQKRAYGELGHPAGPSINLDRVSHLIIELKKDGSKPDFIGKAKITDTPMGKIARGLLEAGSNLGVSCRGMGSLKPGKDGAMEVQGDYRIATAADIVADPSAPNAFVEGIMEGVEWIYDPVKGTWQEEKLHEMKKHIHTISKAELEETRLAMFEEYMASLAIKNKYL
jgi:hypothetical protein